MNSSQLRERARASRGGVRSLGARRVMALALVGFAGWGVTNAGCSQETITVPVRSLERSGRTTFVCLGPVGSAPRPLGDCDTHVSVDESDFALDDAGVPKPHLYALVTQTTRGEIAVVDITANTNSVIDEDDRVPGANFLPIGAQPTDVVATPGSTAAFASVAEVGREGIYALPTSMIRPDPEREVPRLTSWPACALPSAPGTMLLVNDPIVDKKVRASCDAEYANEALAGDNGDLGLEDVGRQKLVVTLPELGGFVVVDAQAILDREAGSYAPCPIEKWVPLTVDLPPPGPEPEPGTALACVSPKATPAPLASSYDARPAGMAYADGRLYLADLEAPVVHVVDLPTPCDPVERDPLLPTSLEDPSRVVTTTRVAVSPRSTPDLKSYLYAIDGGDGSAMVFDVSEGAAAKTPLARPHPEYNPFEAADRVRFASPARDVIIIQRDTPAAYPQTGVAPGGVRCNPDPALVTCTQASSTCGGTCDPGTDPSTCYRTSSDYDAGAGPRKLRGVFAFLLLTSGSLAVIDIDDYDADCRAPTRLDHLHGCDTTMAKDAEELRTSAEASCNVVEPNAPRSQFYEASGDGVGRHEPGVLSYPILQNIQGTIIPSTTATKAHMRATLATEATASALSLIVGGTRENIDASGRYEDDPEQRHALAMNLENPRAQIADQGWSVTFEGALPGFGTKVGDLRVGLDAVGEGDGLFDANSRFCDAGVQSLASVRAILEAEGTPAGELEGAATSFADRLQIAEDVPVEQHPHWSDPGVVGTCTYQQCKNDFGTVASPSRNRDLVIREAYQDHLELDPGPLGDAQVNCCFPTLVHFNVRPANQWVVVGDGSNFLHHVIADPATGVCRNSCDPSVARLNGRVREAPADVVVTDGSPFAFQNPMFRFWIAAGTCPQGADCSVGCVGPTCVATSERGDLFRFITQGSFSPLVVDLRTDTTDVQPQSVGLVPPTGQLVVTDGSLEGLLMVSTESVALVKKFF